MAHKKFVWTFNGLKVGDRRVVGLYMSVTNRCTFVEKN